jgi:hypothetical protein
MSGSNKSGKDREALREGNFDVLFCTAELLRNHLVKNEVDMRMFSLLVIDEIHHADGAHPFLKLLNDHFLLTDLDTRPRLLGLTASPVSGGIGDDVFKSLDKKIQALKTNTQAEIYSPVIFKDSINRQARNADWRLFEPSSEDRELFLTSCQFLQTITPLLQQNYPTVNFNDSWKRYEVLMTDVERFYGVKRRHLTLDPLELFTFPSISTNKLSLEYQEVQ